MEVGHRAGIRFALRRTLCLRQYYLDQVIGYNLSSVNMLLFVYDKTFCPFFEQIVSEYNILTGTPRVATYKGNTYYLNSKREGEENTKLVESTLNSDKTGSHKWKSCFHISTISLKNTKESPEFIVNSGLS